MQARLVLTLAALAGGVPPGGTGVSLDGLPPPARAASLFDESYALGQPDGNERADALDVPALFRALARGERRGYAEDDPGLRCLGDVLAFLRGTPGAGLDRRLEELARRAPAFAHELAWILPELLRQESFRPARWKGRKDYRDDGFLSLRGWWPWHGYYRARWPRFEPGTQPQAYQVVTLIFHDLPEEYVPRDAAEALARVRRVAREHGSIRDWRGLSLRLAAALVPDSLYLAPGGDALSYAVRYELERSWPPTFVVQVRERLEGADLVVESYCADGPWRFFAGREACLILAVGAGLQAQEGRSPFAAASVQLDPDQPPFRRMVDFDGDGDLDAVGILAADDPSTRYFRLASYENDGQGSSTRCGASTARPPSWAGRSSS